MCVMLSKGVGEFSTLRVVSGLGVLWPHLPCEMAKANSMQFQRFSPRFSSTFRSISIDFLFQSVSVSFNEVNFNQF